MDWAERTLFFFHPSHWDFPQWQALTSVFTCFFDKKKINFFFIKKNQHFFVWIESIGFLDWRVSLFLNFCSFSSTSIRLVDQKKTSIRLKNQIMDILIINWVDQLIKLGVSWFPSLFMIYKSILSPISEVLISRKSFPSVFSFSAFELKVRIINCMG